MDTKTMIREVKNVAEKHKNDRKFTGQTVITDMCNDIIPKLEKLSEYETAEAEGRLVVLPCKVEDTVYVIENKYIEVFEVNEIKFKHKVFGDVTYYLEKPSRRGCLYKYYDSELGDKWFIAREEAEKALKEIENKI